jgi:hypothetical protein
MGSRIIKNNLTAIPIVLMTRERQTIFALSKEIKMIAREFVHPDLKL